MPGGHEIGKIPILTDVQTPSGGGACVQDAMWNDCVLGWGFTVESLHKKSLLTADILFLSLRTRLSSEQSFIFVRYVTLFLSKLFYDLVNIDMSFPQQTFPPLMPGFNIALCSREAAFHAFQY
ncbi:hypothetical protein M514_23553 [Trichuris suis]|uniref:Uncharacterized protein n=1 Tax=Trichuris suis TaxID=68888 RepID=A0A085N473_9BILA|nr:hypothetical protein M514_23553 [Trichuris suis]